MDNIFENAYFGKAYKTRDGRKAIYNFHSSGGFHDIIIDGEGISYHFMDHTNGIINLPINQQPNVDYRSPIDIVSEWQEERQVICWNNLSEDEKSELMIDIVSTRKPIDEEKLNEMANECYYEMSDVADVNCADIKEAFKRGYRKAMEE